MSRLSRCKTNRGRYRPLPSRRTVAITLCAGALLLFALAQLNIRFALHDLRQETTRLQKRKMELRSQVNRLKGQVEAQKQAERLIVHAKADLGMAPYAPSEVERVTVAREIRDRYANIELVRARPAQTDAERRDKTEWAEAVASRLGIDGRAVAASAAE